MSMDSELSESQISPTPKLSLFSLPVHTPDPPPESVTPPLQTPASVPFKWEEAPGKPRRSFVACETPAKPRAARCLELPPCKITNSPSPEPSPSSVLDGLISGPKVCKTTSFSFRKLLKGDGKITNLPSPLNGTELVSGPNVSKTMSFSFRKMLKGEGKMTNTPSPSSVLYGPDPDISQMTCSFRGPEEGLVWKLIDKEKVNFSSLRWGSETGFEEESEGNFDFSSPFGDPEENGTRIRKRIGFWANFYKNIKQVVPWSKRRQEKRRRTNI